MLGLGLVLVRNRVVSLGLVGITVGLAGCVRHIDLFLLLLL